jgi:hypothetical protein
MVPHRVLSYAAYILTVCGVLALLAFLISQLT